jgi:threonine/homoserine/homoserine lactone efflux protein
MQKKMSIVLGTVFVLVAILGMIGTPIVGHATGAYFMTNIIHDVVHLVIGLVLLYVALKKTSVLATTLKTVGVIYLLVAALGFAAVETVSNAGSILGLVDVNTADNWLHVVLGVVILGLGLCKCSKDSSAM